MNGDDDGLPDDALSSARDGPAGQIAKNMLDSIIGESVSDNAQGGATADKMEDSCRNNTPEGSIENAGNSIDLDLNKTTEAGDTAEQENMKELDSYENETSRSTRRRRESGTSGSGSKRSESGGTYTVESELNTERDLSRLMTPTPTSTEVGEALVTEVMTKVKASLEATASRGIEDLELFTAVASTSKLEEGVTQPLQPSESDDKDVQNESNEVQNDENEVADEANEVGSEEGEAVLTTEVVKEQVEITEEVEESQEEVHKVEADEELKEFESEAEAEHDVVYEKVIEQTQGETVEFGECQEFEPISAMTISLQNIQPVASNNQNVDETEAEVEAEIEAKQEDETVVVPEDEKEAEVEAENEVKEEDETEATLEEKEAVIEAEPEDEAARSDVVEGATSASDVPLEQNEEESGEIPVSENKIDSDQEGDNAEDIKQDFLDSVAEVEIQYDVVEYKTVSRRREMCCNEMSHREMEECVALEEQVVQVKNAVPEKEKIEEEASLELVAPPVIVEELQEKTLEDEKTFSAEFPPMTFELLDDIPKRGAVNQKLVKVAMMEETIAGLKKSLEESESKVASQEEQLNLANLQLEAAKSSMEEKIKRYEIQLSEVMGQLRLLKDSAVTRRNSGENGDVKDKLETDIKTYQEQIQQDALAICTLETRLDKVVKKNKEYQVEVKELAKTIQDLKTERQALVSRIQQLELSGPQPSDQPPPMPKVLIQRPVQNDLASLAEIARLQREQNQLKKEISEHVHCIEGLRRDLVGADARLSDMAGELSESQKEALEDANARADEKEAELTKVKGQVKELNDLVEKFKVEVIGLKDNLREQKSRVEEYRGTASDQSVQIKDLQDQLTAGTKRHKENANQKQSRSLQSQSKSKSSEGPIEKEFAALGSRCQGERHDETIHHQREALAELRVRLKALEQIKPSNSSNQDQALSQIFMLKRELAELRAKQASQTLDQRHHIIRKIQTNQVSANQAVEGQEDVTGSTEGHGIRSPSPGIGLPSINKSLESKQRLTAVLKDPKNTRPRILQNGGDYSLEEKPRTPRTAWLEGSSSGEDNSGRGTPLAETDINFGIFRHPAPPEKPRSTARSSSRTRPRSANVVPERGSEDLISNHGNHESFESYSSKRNQAEAEMERSAHNETSKALDLSEEIYLQTLKTLAGQLGLSDIPGGHSIAHLPQDQRSAIGAKRLEALQMLSTRVEAVKERVERKDQLLQGYEKDLEKLRNAEQANQEMNAKIENLSAELRAKSDESHYLRESLSRSREKFDQEARLNSAIKLKKTFHLENEFSHINNTTTRARPSSATDEKKKKDQVEVLKKKNYEIRQLKSSLAEREKELYDVKRRHMILQDMQKNVQVETSRPSSRRSSAGKTRPPALHSKQSKRQSQSSISFQEGVVEIPLESESNLIDQSEELTQTGLETADQSEPLTTETQSEHQSEFTTDVTNQSESRNENIEQSEIIADDVINETEAVGNGILNGTDLVA